MDMDELALRWGHSRAVGYEVKKKRLSPQKWIKEHRVISEILHAIGPGKNVLDIPVGTGRLIELYQKARHSLTGIDISESMLNEARARAAKLGYAAKFHLGDVRDIPYPDGRFDLVICMSFLSWVDLGNRVAVLKELNRVSRGDLIVGARHVLPVGEVSARALGMLLRRQVARTLRPIRKRGASRKSIIPLLSSELESFERAGLRIVRSVAVECRHSDGTESSVYWLRRVDAS